MSAAAKHKAADVSAGKRFQLFGGKCSDDARKNMLLDDVAIYSVTDARTADRITKTALALPGGPHREVCDGCACVGGNVISFARALRKGGRVTGIEFDATRCEFLKHNVATAGVPAEILRGDVARATAEEDTDDGDGWACRSAVRRADLLFLDPPWGGPDVARKPAGSVRLHLGGVDVGELCRRVAGDGLPREARAPQAAAELRRRLPDGDAGGRRGREGRPGLPEDDPRGRVVPARRGRRRRRRRARKQGVNR